MWPEAVRGLVPYGSPPVVFETVKKIFLTMATIINIKGVDYEAKNYIPIRAMMLYEEATGKSQFVPSTILENCIFFYALLTSWNHDKGTLTWDDFLEAIDTDPSILQTLSSALSKAKATEEILSPASEKADGTDSKKK